MKSLALFPPNRLARSWQRRFERFGNHSYGLPGSNLRSERRRLQLEDPFHINLARSIRRCSPGHAVSAKLRPRKRHAQRAGPRTQGCGLALRQGGEDSPDGRRGRPHRYDRALKIVSKRGATPRGPHFITPKAWPARVGWLMLIGSHLLDQTSRACDRSTQNRATARRQNCPPDCFTFATPKLLDPQLFHGAPRTCAREPSGVL